MARSTWTNILYASQFDERMARLRLKAQSSYFYGVPSKVAYFRCLKSKIFALRNPGCSGYDGGAVPAAAR